jgi:hypothetical protein
MRDTFPMSRRAIECGKTLDETLDETLEETLADTLPSTPARLGSPYDWTTGFEPAATVEHGAPGAHRQLHAITGARAHHPGRPQPPCALPPAAAASHHAPHTLPPCPSHRWATTLPLKAPLHELKSVKHKFGSY